MEIKLRNYSSIYIIDVKGEIDLYNSHKLKEVISKMKEKNIKKYIINFEEVNYIDSSGIGTIISIHSNLKNEGMKLWLTNVHGSVKRVIELTKLEGFLPIVKDLQEAIKKMED